MHSEWTFIEVYSEKKQGYVWKVKREIDEQKQYGYFKFIKEHNIPFAGPMVANEMIAKRLGERIELPMHQLEYATIDGHDGVVSIVKPITDPDKLYRWDQLPEKVCTNIADYFKKPKHLINLFVFDVWTCNTDRGTNKNLIAYLDGDEPKYQIYVFDHNHALHDADHKWEKRPYDNPYWNQIHRYYRCPIGVEELVLANPEYVHRCIRRIEAVQKKEIKKIVWDIPSKYITRKERKLIYKLLLHRQGRLMLMINDWFKRQVALS